MICHASNGSVAISRVPASRREPVRIGELLPDVLARYGLLMEERPAAPRRVHPMAAAWLGQSTLAELADVA
ncbi:MAG TPA: hypothetical protein VL096_18830 [Pirellulaceae bacterium]|nr:hypothetical protein [Pirellulaceae bacterium]